MRYLSGFRTGLFSDRRMLQEIRELALEYGRKHGGNFVRAVTESSDTAANLALLDDTASDQQAALRTEDDSKKPQGPGQAAVIASASTSLLDASVLSPAPGAGKAVRARQSRPSLLSPTTSRRTRSFSASSRRRSNSWRDAGSREATRAASGRHRRSSRRSLRMSSRGAVGRQERLAPKRLLLRLGRRRRGRAERDR